jgi:hypothetical protein
MIFHRGNQSFLSVNSSKYCEVCWLKMNDLKSSEINKKLCNCSNFFGLIVLKDVV